MADMQVRPMEARDRSEVAELICVSTNAWYEKRGGPTIFTRGPESTGIYYDVYEAMDPGCGIVAENTETGRLMGSCFYHPRPEHVSLGIMNVHPNYFGRGVASALLKHIIDYTESNGYASLRLVSSAMNLDSFSLYTRYGFIPRYVYQDMVMEVPESGFPHATADADRVRAAAIEDAEAMAAVEKEVTGITRGDDYRYCIENRDGIWESLVYEGAGGGIEGFMISSQCAASNIIGPGAMRTQGQAAALVARALQRYRGGAALLIVPTEQRQLVEQLYAWGARNCEIHLCQVRGAFQPFRGVNMPTFFPESG
ncbi:MAG: GNAT family N-acetyltransferase [Planctomycetes bacterium]|nr:GNAT family N-acetyltransferase [Planctomycetota bacterium]